jgi:dihydropteroate synthase
MLAAPGLPTTWRTARGALAVDRPVIAGVLNATPDSFWDGGLHQEVDAALRRAEVLLQGGATILDVGGESTRPGAEPVDADAEMRRVVPLVAALLREFPGTMISVDTVKAAVADAALSAGAAIINDVSGLRLDPHLAAVAARHDAGLILMHSRGTVATMARYELAEYTADVAGDVVSELQRAVQRARDGGVPGENLVVDPGLGFAKTTRHSLAVLGGLGRLAELRLPILVGPSRKRFIGDAAGGLPADQRLPGTIAACVLALQAGARLFRVHDVTEVNHGLQLAWAALMAAEGQD